LDISITCLQRTSSNSHRFLMVFIISSRRCHITSHIAHSL
jgi:hypothetical protein